MAYTALYRKWRPRDFSEVRGQEAVVRTLKNQLLADRIGHAYLFCGTRGTGKTSVAKIFARAVNCEHPVDGSPCNTCSTCQAILSGSSMNVVEIDAASNNGVDNIREIRDEVMYAPTEGRYRVYIIDEVHMLSAGAYNALLKTLEEPPSYVIFILATTELHKIPVTVLSRCQRYDFKRISADTIEDQLKGLMEKEGLSAEEEAVRFIARSADGAMRDALSILEQCISFYYGEKLTYEQVLEVVGAVDLDVFARLLAAIRGQLVTKAMEVVEELVQSGRDLGQTMTDFAWYLRNIMLARTTLMKAEDLGISRENMALIRETADTIELPQVLYLIRLFSDLANQLKTTSQKRLFIEVAIMRAMAPTEGKTLEALEARLLRLEEMVQNGVSLERREPVRESRESAGESGETPAPQAAPAVAYAEPTSPGDVADRNEIQEKLPEILKRIKGGLFRALIKNSEVRWIEGRGIVFVTKAYDGRTMNFDTPDHRNLNEIVAEVLGRRVAVSFAPESLLGAEAGTAKPANDFSEDVHWEGDIEQVDE